MEILLELIENFFILWFVLVCFKINIFKDIQRFSIVTSIATFCAMLIQQLRLISVDDSLNMLLNMIFGIVLYAYLAKCFYWNEVRFFKAIGLTLIYFLVFILLGESIWINIFKPFIAVDLFDTTQLVVVIMLLLYRLVEIFLFLLIWHTPRKEKYV